MSASLPSLYGSNESIHPADEQTTNIPQQPSLELNGESHPTLEIHLLSHHNPDHCPSAHSSNAEDVKNELKQLLKYEQHFDQLLELTAFLTKCSREGLLMMDIEGLVEHVFDAVNKDCMMTFGVEINIKNLSVYFYKKKCKAVALQFLTCDEVLSQ